MPVTPAKKAAGKPAASTSSAPAAPVKNTKVGVVDSDSRNKTRRVLVSYTAKHPKYGKYVRQRTILQVHDEQNESHNGDVVEVAPCRPMSKTKFWKLVRIVERRAELTAALQSVKEVQ